MTTLTWSVLFGLFFGVGIVLLWVGARGGVARAAPNTGDTTPVGPHQTWTWRTRSTRLLLAAVVGLAAWWCTGWPVGGLAAAGAVLGLPPLVNPAGPRQVLARLEALTAWTRRLGDLLASGAGGLEHAIAYSAATTPAPLHDSVTRLAQRIPLLGLEPALRAFADELADPAADEVVASLIVRARAGGRGLTDILHAKATALAAETTSRRDVEADRATPRSAVRSLVLITVLMVTGLVAFAHDYLAPFSAAAGQGVLAGITGLFVAALWWMHRLSTPRRPGRSLTTVGGRS